MADFLRTSDRQNVHTCLLGLLPKQREDEEAGLEAEAEPDQGWLWLLPPDELSRSKQGESAVSETQEINSNL